MKEILVRLYRLFGLAKDLHYGSAGLPFYGLHLMFDRVADGLLDAADRIQEGYFLARDLPAPKSADIYAEAAADKREATPEALRDLLRETIYRIDQLSADDPELSEGDKTILGDISADLAAKLGFINRTLASAGGK